MKDKLKKIVLYLGISYMIIVIILMFISYFASTKYIEFGDNDYQKIIDDYKEKSQNIDEDSCREYFNSLLDFITKNNYTGKVDIKTIASNTVFNDETILSYYLKGIDSCSKLTKEIAEEKGFSTLFLTSSVTNDSLLEKYSFQYELSYPDRIIRVIVSPSAQTVQNKIIVESELEIIKEVYEIVNDEVENEN